MKFLPFLKKMEAERRELEVIDAVIHKSYINFF